MRHLESKLQISCVTWFDLQYPRFKLNFFSIPNEGSRTPQNGARMKAQGRRAGVADMFLAQRTKMAVGKDFYFGLFIEFKAIKGKQSEPQMAFQKAVEYSGYRYEIITSFDAFKSLIESYLA